LNRAGRRRSDFGGGMAGKIDWHYHRNGCMTCKRAQGYLEKNALQASEVVDARKHRKNSAEALKLARTAETIVVAKGTKVTTFDMTKAPPDDATLLTYLLGPTGNLRAPAIRKGKTLLIGFSEEAYREVLS
jgi:arsenate reductase-like glutaredoxin family protein